MVMCDAECRWLDLLSVGSLHRSSQHRQYAGQRPDEWLRDLNKAWVHRYRVLEWDDRDDVFAERPGKRQDRRTSCGSACAGGCITASDTEMLHLKSFAVRHSSVLKW
jgi:hypothetical protein